MMNYGDISENVLTAIWQTTEDSGGDDEDLVKDAVATEENSYSALLTLDFGVTAKRHIGREAAIA